MASPEKSQFRDSLRARLSLAIDMANGNPSRIVCNRTRISTGSKPELKLGRSLALPLLTAFLLATGCETEGERNSDEQDDSSQDSAENGSASSSAGDDSGSVETSNESSETSDEGSTATGDDSGDTTKSTGDDSSGTDTNSDTSSDSNSDTSSDTSSDTTSTSDMEEYCYEEPIDPEASLDDLVAAYTEDRWELTLLEALDRRWPAGKYVFDNVNDPMMYFGTFTSDKSSMGGLADDIMTEQHEMTHLWDLGNTDWKTYIDFKFHEELSIRVPILNDFPRAEIFDLIEPGSTDGYRDLYFVGDQGSRGFFYLLDELNCYVNGMSALSYLGEFYPGQGVSGRDGALAFLYYMELYLQHARKNHSDVYDEMKASAEMRKVVETMWLRAHFHLQHSLKYPKLGIFDEDIFKLMYKPELIEELNMFVGKTFGEDHCVTK